LKAEGVIDLEPQVFFGGGAVVKIEGEYFL
jgi:hypothetical protein